MKTVKGLNDNFVEKLGFKEEDNIISSPAPKFVDGKEEYIAIGNISNNYNLDIRFSDGSSRDFPFSTLSTGLDSEQTIRILNSMFHCTILVEGQNLVAVKEALTLRKTHYIQQWGQERFLQPEIGVPIITNIKILDYIDFGQDES